MSICGELGWYLKENKFSFGVMFQAFEKKCEESNIGSMEVDGYC